MSRFFKIFSANFLRLAVCYWIYSNYELLEKEVTHHAPAAISKVETNSENLTSLVFEAIESTEFANNISANGIGQSVSDYLDLDNWSFDSLEKDSIQKKLSFLNFSGKKAQNISLILK